MELFRSHVLICGGTGCTSSGSVDLLHRFQELVKENHLENEIKLVHTGCFGLCAAGPVIIIYPEGAFYSRVSLKDVDTLFHEHLMKGNIVKDLLYKDGIDHVTGKLLPLDDTPFYKKQNRTALRNCGVIDPEDINEYIARDGYQALYKVLHEMSREEVIDTIKKSGLRGRGGGGFSTGMKWQFTYAAQGDKKYVCCNAD